MSSQSWENIHTKLIRNYMVIHELRIFTREYRDQPLSIQRVCIKLEITKDSGMR